MAVLGPRALIDLAVPTGIDGAKVLQWQLRDGTTGPQAIARAAAVIGEVNQRVYGKYSGLLYITQEIYARYRQGGAGSKSRHTPWKADL
jgi:hypothetical protein